MSEGIEIRHGCQFISSLVRAAAKLPGGLGRFLPCSVGSHMSRLRHLEWNQCSHGLTFRPLESCHHQCLTAVCEVLGYPKGSALELLDGTLKLQHCIGLFTMRLPPWSLPRVGTSGEKRRFFVPGHPLDAGGKVGKSVRLTRKTRPGVSSHSILILGIQRRGDGKDCAPLPPKEWGVRLACLAILGFAPGDAWNLPSEGTGVVVFSGWSVQPKGLVRWH